MKDTLKETEIIEKKLWSEKSGVNKIEMASLMFDAAREIVLASLPKGLSKKEKRVKLFLRFYKADFDNKRLESIIKYLEK